jgi:hypothetical protein
MVALKVALVGVLASSIALSVSGRDALLERGVDGEGIVALCRGRRSKIGMLPVTGWRRSWALPELTVDAAWRGVRLTTQESRPEIAAAIRAERPE